MKDILKSFAVGAAVASALIGGTYLAARVIDAAEGIFNKKDEPSASDTPAK